MVIDKKPSITGGQNREAIKRINKFATADCHSTVVVSISGRYQLLQIDVCRARLLLGPTDGSRVRRTPPWALFLGRGPRPVSQKEKSHSAQDSAWGVPISRVKSHPPLVRIICRQRSRPIARGYSAIDLRLPRIVKRAPAFPTKTSRPVRTHWEEWHSPA